MGEFVCCAVVALVVFLVALVVGAVGDVEWLTWWVSLLIGLVVGFGSWVALALLVGEL